MYTSGHRFSLDMRNITTEKITIPRALTDDLEAILRNAERLLIKDKKHPLRTVLLDLSDTEATVLISFIYDSEQ